MELKPSKIEDSYAFMFESSYLLLTTKHATGSELNYSKAWEVIFIPVLRSNLHHH